MIWSVFICALVPVCMLVKVGNAFAPSDGFRSCRHWCIAWLVLIGMLRIGEATNPGPTVLPEVPSFSLGLCNPSGLRNKAQYVHSQMSAGDVWMFAETHFFGKDLTRFRAILRAAKSRFKY